MVADARDSVLGPNMFEATPHHASSRRLRPTDLAITTSDENRIPLRAEKLNRRESRIGLRSLFGRQKAGNEEDVGARDLPGRSAGIRASLVSNWPYGLHGQRSEITLPFFSHSSQTASSPLGNDHLKHKKSASAVKAPSSPRSTQRAAWDPPPLFQAYPQAIKHVLLPACTLPTEAILRLHGQRSGLRSRDGTDGTEDSAGDKHGKPRRGHRRNKSGSSFKTDWTTKIYVLVTSGYLLQYAGEGSFDRLPERMLHLGKDSAAFASDVIPGRHWVLQVSSTIDLEGPTAPHSNSLFSRLPFRGVVPERRQASNFLMVFNSAKDMESWIVILRREIEALGGKKSLSETGKPKVDDTILRLRTQPSQRTLVVRESSRFSKVLSQEIPWDQAAAVAAAAAAAMANRDIRLSSTDSDAGRDQSFDDTSTASGISHDGRQLDALRDSTHRLSYMSSGQRTMITSAGSSPSCSPVRDSFGSQLGSHFEDLSIDDQGQSQETQQWPRPRPNASAILDRRQSMQTANHLAEMRVASVIPRPFSITYSSSWQSQSSSAAPHGTSPPEGIPNFSVPHSAGKRYSITLQQPPETSPHQPTGLTRPHRRPPPSAISINPRPLSLVVDQPSPNPSTPGSLDQQLALPEEVIAPDTPSIFSTWGQEDVQIDVLESQETPSPPTLDTDLSPVDSNFGAVAHSELREHTSITTIRTSITATELENEEHSVTFSTEVSSLRQPWKAYTGPVTPVPRSRSSLDNHRPKTAVSPLSSSAPANAHFKRFSLHASSLHTVGRDSEVSVTITSITAQDSSIRAHTPTLFKSPPSNAPCALINQRLSVDPTSKGLFNRRSMTRLAEIPPPAPPPTCALPPLPPPRKP